MAKKEKPKFNYNLELKFLKENGPQRLYLLYGREEYLRERFLEELKKLCVPEEDEFSLRRLSGPAVDLGELEEAVNAMPFFAPRSLVEVRDYDLNKCRDAEAERLKAILSDIPDYCTVAFVQSAANEPDGRLAAVKALKKLGRAVEFIEQDQDALTRWVANRFSALGKSLSRADAEYLIFLCGTLMNGLIPEIEKAAAHAQGAVVTRADIDATANRIPEADVFEMTDLLASGKIDRAARLLSDLLADKNNHPIMLLALIGQQMRRLYAVKLAQAAGRGKPDIMELTGVRYDFIYNKLLAAAKPYSLEGLKNIVALCAEYDFKMKSSGLDAAMLLRELLARIAVEK
ncbi:MAG: DNA polymerase III subunit delta [Oscillospiraceae bacterium]